jgi:tRNA A-37 threonylcarbamoyl transferase component Bud32/tetratricopeptide (TPR) repeat protein
VSSDLQARLQAALGDAYRLERELGRGGMATVYLARDVKHDRLVAVKVLHPELAASLGPQRFLREIHVTARLDHPHILPVLDSGGAPSLLWYAMPYVEGETLRDRLRRETQLPVDEALRIAREVADALDYAHRHNVIHRDIKPENILLADSHARVADFGVARALEVAAGEALTGTGLAVGTPAYMSPEQASAGQVDRRSDIYALGCVLYETLTGEPPFTGPTAQAIIAKRFVGPIPSVRTTRPDVQPALDVAIQKSLAPVPADRFNTAGEFAQAVSGASSGAVGGSRKRRASRVVVGVAILGALALSIAGLLWRSRAAPHVLDGNLLAVAPFDILDPKLELWHEGLVDLLARNLDGAGPLRTVPPTTVIRRWTGRADQVSGAELARRTGARLTVFGSLVPAGGDSVRLRATLFDAATGQALAELDLRDATARIDRLTDSLTVRLLSELGRNRRIELTRVASLGSTSLPALKAFLQGEQWFRRTGWDSALASYERAVTLDSSFCLALWRLARVLGWQRIGSDSLSVALALRAGGLNRGLAPRDSLLVTADSLMGANTLEGRSTLSRYRRLSTTARETVRRYPDDVDAWHTLGEVYVHAGISRGVPVAEALAAFDRAISLDSAFAPAYIHAIELASYIHGLDAARIYALEYLRRAPEDVTAAGIQLALNLADPSRAHDPEVERALNRASANVLLKAWLPFIGATDSGEVAVRVARALAASPDSSAPWLPASVRRGFLLVSLIYRGHLKEAAVAWRPSGLRASSRMAELSLVGYRVPDSAVAYFSEWLRAGDLERSQAGLTLWTTRRDSLAIRRFQRLADSLMRSSGDSSLREESGYWAAAASAYLSLLRRDSSVALTQFERLPDSLCAGCYFEPFTRLLLRAARGEDRKVVDTPWPAAFFPSARDVMARLAQARAADRLGEGERARAAYKFVAEAWQHADPELQPYVAEARQALARLTSEPRP